MINVAQLFLLPSSSTSTTDNNKKLPKNSIFSFCFFAFFTGFTMHLWPKVISIFYPFSLSLYLSFVFLFLISVSSILTLFFGSEICWFKVLIQYLKLDL